MVDQGQFRDAMARLGAAVNIITSDGSSGRCGLTATAVCSVTDTPPTILVCINRSAASYPVVRGNGVLGVNILGAGHQQRALNFANNRLSLDERFGDSKLWTTLTTGAPVFVEAVAALDCRVTEVIDKGTHGVFFCEVKGLQIQGRMESLVYFDRAFHEIESSQDNSLASLFDIGFSFE